ncbi:MAG: thioredoxin domain-containing protein [Lachnospiraceae bacterium]|nr:thioredoxin domain-containing protein [Lachnospiraceae bacterium]
MKKPNHLMNEKSPYLQQHIYDPIDWYPWGRAAFERAKNEDKPIFLSIGYSSCHWCHVMKQESFEDDEVARILNGSFLAIQVDREERPDIDAVYMKVCQILNGQGGWPLTVMMTADQKPFFADTYVPKESRNERKGLLELLKEVEKEWKINKEKIIATSEKISSFVKKEERKEIIPLEPEFGFVQKGYRSLCEAFDEENGGFYKAPKFPVPGQLMFLMEYARRTGDQVSIHMAKKTLTSMYRGGIFDHVGGGFCRYSTDSKWQIPHFEKMLYDNALLILAYARAYEMTGDSLYEYVAAKTISYVVSELLSPEGGFYCGQDADSDGEEGKFYLFTPTEICMVLGKGAGEEWNAFYHVTEKGNFHYSNVLNLTGNEDYRKAPLFDGPREKLCKYRKERLELGIDDKILVSWNGLMIAALSLSAAVFEKDAFYGWAKKVLAFLEDNMSMGDGALMARYKDGQVAHHGTLCDYAYLCFGLLMMYEYSQDVMCLSKMSAYLKYMIEEFFDFENGGFYLYGKHAEPLLLRPKEIYDGALPSGNAMAAYVLEMASEITGKEIFEVVAKKQLAFLSGIIKENPAGHAFGLLALMQEIYLKRQLVVVVSKPAKREEYMPESALRKLLREGVMVIVKTRENEAKLAGVAPFSMQYEIKKDGILYYYCENHSCMAPVSDLQDIIRQFEEES